MNISWTIRVHFGKSPSCYFKDAYAVASRSPSFVQTETGYEVVYSAFQLNDFFDLYFLISEWKSTYYIINETRYRKEITSMLLCLNNRIKNGNENYGYGINTFYQPTIFSCIHTQKGWRDDWEDFGEMQENGMKKIDKDAVLAALLDRLSPYKECPCLSLSEITKQVRSLPNQVQPKQPEPQGIGLTFDAREFFLKYGIDLNKLLPDDEKFVVKPKASWLPRVIYGEKDNQK